MKNRDLSMLASILMTCALAAPVLAGVGPYVRLDYGGNELRMTGQNSVIRESEALHRAAGYPAAFQAIGTGYGPGVSVGMWMLPGFRVGATYSYLRAVRINRLGVADEISYSDKLDIRMNEVGAEAAVRIKRLAGLTLGASVAQGWAEMIEDLNVEDPHGLFYLDATSRRTQMTYGGFVGIDQTNAAGVAGFIRAGFQYRDMGHMPTDLTFSDGTTSVQETDRRMAELDYSGFYVKVGVGYDLVH
jgi:hypothetical protein